MLATVKAGDDLTKDHHNEAGILQVTVEDAIIRSVGAGLTHTGIDTSVSALAQREEC